MIVISNNNYTNCHKIKYLTPCVILYALFQKQFGQNLIPKFQKMQIKLLYIYDEHEGASKYSKRITDWIFKISTRNLEIDKKIAEITRYNFSKISESTAVLR